MRLRLNLDLFFNYDKNDSDGDYRKGGDDNIIEAFFC